MGLFDNLKRLFSSDVVIRNVGGDELRVIDTDRIQSLGTLQTNALVDRFTKIYTTSGAGIYNLNNVYNYQTLRVQLYTDYEAMDTDSIVASALDIIADECTLKNEHGEMLHIRSSDENIQRILYNLFYDVLNIEFNLWSWARNMCKYGDFYLKLEIAEKFGVYNVIPFSAYSIIREEGTNPKNPTYVKFKYDPTSVSGITAPQTQYALGTSTSDIYFENYEMAHFRLISDVNYLPYGRCLHPNSRITTENSIKEIKDIIKGDKVWTFNIEENKYELADVLATVNSGIKKIYSVKTVHNEVKGSDNHPILVWDFDEEKPNYKQIKDLKKGDYLCSYKQADIKLSNPKLNKYNLINSKYNVELFKIKSITEELPEETYDIQVSKNSNFISDGIIVHNSYLEPGRKIFKQMILMEDAMLIHRIVRAPEKRIFYMNVGAIPPNEVEAFMQKTVQKLKKVPYVDPQTGQYNLKYNMMNMMEDFYIPVRGNDQSTRIDTAKGLEYNGIEDVAYLRDKLFAALKIPKAFMGYEKDLCISPDTKIPLIDGRTLTALEIINEYNEGKKNYVYSLDEATNNIVPGEIEWAGFTRMNTQTVKVWLDNNEYIQCTPDHLFLTREGEWKEAQNLSEDESLMPLYLKQSTNKDINGYTQVYNPSIGKYEYVHRLVAEHYNLKQQDKVIHHKVSKIEWVTGNIDTCDLTISKYHNFGTSAGVIIHNSGKATLAAEDIRFARTVERIQRILLSELTKIALVHLYSQGYDGESLTNFDLSLTTPSIIYDQERVNLMKEKVELASQIIENNLLPTDWIYDNLFHFSQDQYDEYRDLLVQDKAFKFRLAQIEGEGNDPSETGQVYGTPHQLATAYGKGRGVQDVPTGYNEKDPNEPVHLVGRPKSSASNINRQDNPFGKDRIGTKTYSTAGDDQEDSLAKTQWKGGSPLALETYLKNKNIFDSIPVSRKTNLFEQSNLLDENNIRDEIK